MAKSWRTWIGAVVLVAGMSWSGAANAQSLSISPSRVVLEGRDRSAELTLYNQSDETLTYRIVFRRLEMTPQGQFRELDAQAPGKFVDAFVRYSPRQVSLGPGESQKVRLMVRAPANLGDGEYRSHLTFQALPTPGETEHPTSSNSIDVSLKMRTSVSLPVIYRRGELSAQFEVEELQLEQQEGRATATMRLHRDGQRSLYGDYELLYVPRPGLPAEMVGAVRGVAFYAPGQERELQFPLSQELAALSGGQWQVRHIERHGDQRTPGQIVNVDHVTQDQSER